MLNLTKQTIKENKKIKVKKILRKSQPKNGFLTKKTCTHMFIIESSKIIPQTLPVTSICVNLNFKTKKVYWKEYRIY